MIIAGIPAYNEEKTIASVIIQTQRQVDTVVVCDDGSQDMTAEIAQRLGAIVIRHDRNRGYGASLKSLFEKAQELNAEIMVTLDADGQHDPREIHDLVQPILEAKADIAIGSRLLRRDNGVPLYRRIGIKLFTIATSERARKVTNGNNHGQHLTDSQCGLRAYNRRAIETTKLSEDGMGASLEILLQARDKGLVITEVPVKARYDGLDTSTLHPVQHGVNLIGTIIRLVVEERPLVYLGIPGIVILQIGILFGIWAFQIYVTTYPRWLRIDIVLVSIVFIIVGFLAMFSAITLFAIVRHRERLQQLR